MEPQPQPQSHCPGCMQIFQPPFTRCENGHNICRNCMRDLNDCNPCQITLQQIEIQQADGHRIEIMVRDLQSSILHELTCHGCKEYIIAPPIRMCYVGHNFCEKCEQRFQCCPQCNANCLETRNIALENLASLVHYPCRFRNYGCLSYFSSTEIQEHHKECLYKIFECPISEDGLVCCSWKGTKAHLKGHLRNNHSTKFWEVEDTLVQKLLDVTQGKFFEAAIFVHEELFYRRFEYIPEGFFGYVKYIGPKKLSEKFSCTLATVTARENREEILSVCCKTHAFEDNKLDILGSNCLKIMPPQLEYFLNEDRELRTITKIIKIEQED